MLFSQNLARSYSFFRTFAHQNEGADRIVNKITIYIKVVRHSHTIVLNISLNQESHLIKNHKKNK